MAIVDQAAAAIKDKPGPVTRRHQRPTGRDIFLNMEIPIDEKTCGRRLSEDMKRFRKMRGAHNGHGSINWRGNWQKALERRQQECVSAS
jgi:hypothetical protein